MKKIFFLIIIVLFVSCKSNIDNNKINNINSTEKVNDDKLLQDKEIEEYYLTAVSEGDDPAAFESLGSFYYERHKYDLAEKYYKLAIEKGMRISIYNLSLLYYEQGRFKESKKYAEIADKKNIQEAKKLLEKLKSEGY